MVGDCLDMSPLMMCPDLRDRYSQLRMRSLCRVKRNIFVYHASAVLFAGRPDLRHGSVAGAGANLGQRGQRHSRQHRGGHHLEHRGAGRLSGRIRFVGGVIRRLQCTLHGQSHQPFDHTDGSGGGNDVSFSSAVSDANGVVVVSPDYVFIQPAAIAITVNPPSLNFGTTAVNSCSAVQVTTVTNNGKSPVTVGPFALTGTSVGDFVWGGVGTCNSGQALAPGMSCTHSFKFCPAAAGDHSGADSITNSASSSPAVVSLSGTGSVSAPALAVSPASLSFAGQTGSSGVTPSGLSITNTGTGSLTFTGASDQPWLVLSANSGTAPSTLQVSAATTSLKAGTYTGHVTLTGGGVTKTVTVALTLTSPQVQHSVALSWKASSNPKVVSYSVYRSSISGSSYALSASAIGGVSFSDQSVQPASTYYYVVTAVDDQGRESEYSPQVSAVIP